MREPGYWMPIAVVDSRERPFDAFYCQTGFNEVIFVYIFSGIIVDKIKRADLVIDKKRAEYQEQANPHFGANIKIIYIVSYTHRPTSTHEMAFLLLASGSFAIALFQCR